MGVAAAECSTASLTQVPVQQHADKQRERVAAEQLVGGVVLGDAESRHLGSLPHAVPHEAPPTAAAPVDPVVPTR